MSGGSYDYACFVSDVEDILSKRSDIEQLCERLEGIPYASGPAGDLRALLNEVNELNSKAEKTLSALAGVMKGIEWWDSCDWSERQFREEVEEYMEKGTEGA